MKAIVCEMCSSHDVVKQDGYYVCQSCGTKYSTEDAKKLMVEIEGKVDVSGSAVKIDSSDLLNNYRQLAQRARESGDVVNAAKYYEMVAVQDPNDWEAAFFSVYYQAAGTNIGGIVNAANRVTNTLVPVCKLILKDPSMTSGEDRNGAARIMAGYVKSLCEAFCKAANSHFSQFISVEGAAQERNNRLYASFNMVHKLASLSYSKFGDNKLAAELFWYCYNNAGSCINKNVLRENIIKVDPSAEETFKRVDAKKAELKKTNWGGKSAVPGIIGLILMLAGGGLAIYGILSDYHARFIIPGVLCIIASIVCSVISSKLNRKEREKIEQKYK